MRMTRRCSFPLEDGMEVLYREGGFGLNFVRGMGIIFCWMALLATLGLAAASFLSFPVAAFSSLGVCDSWSLSQRHPGQCRRKGTLGGYNAEKGTRAAHAAWTSWPSRSFKAC